VSPSHPLDSLFKAEFLFYGTIVTVYGLGGMDPAQQPASSEKSHDEELDDAKTEGAFAPIQGPDNDDEEQRRDVPLHKLRSQASRSLEHTWSLNDGVSISGRQLPDEEAGEAGRTETDEEQRFTVHWDENDPMNPRNMTKARRWLIVIIVSMGSLCV
jgi:hypothetical protein